MPNENDVKIAVLEEQLKGIREQQKQQAETTQRMFDKLFAEIDILKAALNRGKGVYAASLTFAGGVGAAALALIQWLMERK